MRRIWRMMRQAGHIGIRTWHVTLSYMAAARQFSARMDASVLDRLDRRGAHAGLNKSRLAERYIDEGMRIDEHPGIVFRDGPAGRRPSLAAGPDAWEVIGVLKGAPERGEAAILYTADYLNLPPTGVRSVVSYYAAYPAEIDEWIARNDAEAEAAEAAWRREQAALA